MERIRIKGPRGERVSGIDPVTDIVLTIVGCRWCAKQQPRTAPEPQSTSPTPGSVRYSAAPLSDVSKPVIARPKAAGILARVVTHLLFFNSLKVCPLAPKK